MGLIRGRDTEYNVRGYCKPETFRMWSNFVKWVAYEPSVCLYANMYLNTAIHWVTLKLVLTPGPGNSKILNAYLSTRWQTRAQFEHGV